MAGQIGLKSFRPSFLVVHTDLMNPGWAGAKGDARRAEMNKLQGGKEEFDAKMGEWAKEDKYKYGESTVGRVFSVGLYQDISDCDSLRSVVADAIEFVNGTYAVTKKNVPPDEPGGMTDYIARAKDCLAGEYKYEWVGEHGSGISLEAGNDPGGDHHSEWMKGMFNVMLDYTQAAESTIKPRRLAKAVH
jgi:hypothetical protein